MFSGIRNMWREARADVASKEAADILERYNCFGSYERYELTSAFDYTKSDFELEHGLFSAWSTEDKSVIAKGLMEGARKGWRTSPAGASGLALLSLYLEAQTLPGEKAKLLVAQIEQWHQQAVQKDINSKR